eukprot:3169826-Rhodomonas_salina.1
MSISTTRPQAFQKKASASSASMPELPVNVEADLPRVVEDERCPGARNNTVRRRIGGVELGHGSIVDLVRSLPVWREVRIEASTAPCSDDS